MRPRPGFVPALDALRVSAMRSSFRSEEAYLFPRQVSIFGIFYISNREIDRRCRLNSRFRLRFLAQILDGHLVEFAQKSLGAALNQRTDNGLRKAGVGGGPPPPPPPGPPGGAPGSPPP